jgi:hypothetical protein
VGLREIDSVARREMKLAQVGCLVIIPQYKDRALYFKSQNTLEASQAHFIKIIYICREPG